MISGVDLEFGRQVLKIRGGAIYGGAWNLSVKQNTLLLGGQRASSGPNLIFGVPRSADCNSRTFAAGPKNSPHGLKST